MTTMAIPSGTRVVRAKVNRSRDPNSSARPIGPQKSNGAVVLATAERDRDGNLKLRLPEPPSSNRWWRMVTVGGQARMLLSREAREYKALVSKALTALGITPAPESATISVTIDWWRSQRRGDLDKRVGVVLDALQGTAYVNDAQITHLEAFRHDSKGTAALVVTIKAFGGQEPLL